MLLVNLQKKGKRRSAKVNAVLISIFCFSYLYRLFFKTNLRTNEKHKLFVVVIFFFAAVYDRPVAIGIAAAGDFMNYKSGVSFYCLRFFLDCSLTIKIFTGSCPGGRDHAVVIVGYGVENGQNFWILRNSWGTGWGEAGCIQKRYSDQ